VIHSARHRLLTAALARFVLDGATAVTLEEIRADAGVSVGTLYHHFPNKTALADALYVELTAAFQKSFLACLREHPDAEGGIKAGVTFYLRWVSENRDAASFLLGQRPAGDVPLREQNRRFFAEVMTWWETHVHYGVLRSLPFDLINALWLGPAHEYTRHWVNGRAQRVPSTVAGALADAAWLTLKEAR
jgi:AcrR family transcriptional regulator